MPWLTRVFVIIHDRSLHQASRGGARGNRAPRRRVAPPTAPSPAGVSSVHMREIPIRDDVIRLGQLLKLAGVADSGAEAKDLLADGAVAVNGEPEQRRGRQLRRGDVVAVAGERIRVA
jgi:ribosome-associated protein